MVKDDSVKRSSGWRLFALLGAIVLAISVVMVGMEWTRSSVPVVGGPAGTRLLRVSRVRNDDAAP